MIKFEVCDPANTMQWTTWNYTMGLCVVKSLTCGQVPFRVCFAGDDAATMYVKIQAHRMMRASLLRYRGEMRRRHKWDVAHYDATVEAVACGIAPEPALPYMPLAGRIRWDRDGKARLTGESPIPFLAPPAWKVSA